MRRVSPRTLQAMTFTRRKPCTTRTALKPWRCQLVFTA
nr:MAG TPA: hypothetical protein [Caudoviricetes sp.]